MDRRGEDRRRRLDRHPARRRALAESPVRCRRSPARGTATRGLLCGPLDSDHDRPRLEEMDTQWTWRSWPRPVSHREPFAGGMEAHTHSLAERSPARGHDVTVYAAGGDGPFDVRACCPSTSRRRPTARRDIVARARPPRSPSTTATSMPCSSWQRRPPDRPHQRRPPPAVRLRRAAGRSVVTATLHTPPTPWLESALGARRARRNPPRWSSVSHANARAWRGVPIDRVITTAST